MAALSEVDLFPRVRDDQVTGGLGRKACDGRVAFDLGWVDDDVPAGEQVVEHLACGCRLVRIRWVRSA